MTATTRVMQTKQIGGSSVPVIREITFIDPTERYQEITLYCGNDESDNADREVHVDSVGAYSVERIDSFSAVDPVSRYWETRHYPDNRTMGESPPPYFIAHAVTHIKHLSLFDTERIDKITYIDPVDRYQETTYTLGPWDDE